MEKEKGYTIFNATYAKELAEKGYKFLGSGINFNNPKMKCFFFADTEELREEVSKHKKQK